MERGILPEDGFQHGEVAAKGCREWAAFCRDMLRTFASSGCRFENVSFVHFGRLALIGRSALGDLRDRQIVEWPQPVFAGRGLRS
jgi:hypothetical protein